MSINKVLAALDAGLQSSFETGTTTDHVPDRCARCQVREHAEDADLCTSCRAYLLGDSDEDPSDTGPYVANLLRSCGDGCRGCAHCRPGWFHRTAAARFQRLDRDGNPTGVPEDLRGYVTMHLNGDPRDNRPENLRVMPATENASVGWFRRHLSVTSALRFVIEYYGYGMRGQYFTDDPRPFTVAEYVSDGWRGVQLVDADGDRMHWVAVASHESRPAAFRVSSSIAVPEYYAVTCERCGAMYACDPQRTAEAHGIIANDGHGAGGSCDPLTRTRAEVTEGHDAEATDAPPGWLAHPRQRRDWQAEALAWARQGRRWLGL